MKKLVILHNILDAQHCFNNKLYKNNILVSTHPVVDVYMKENYSLSCDCLSKFISKEEIEEINDSSMKIGKELLSALDDNITPHINIKFGLKMRLFQPLYSYLGIFQLISYKYFVKTLENAITKYDVKTILAYDIEFRHLLKVNSSMKDIVSLFPKGCDIQIINNKFINDKKDRNNFFSMPVAFINKIIRKRRKIFEKILRESLVFRNRNGLLKSKKTILMYGNLYDLEFLRFNPRIYRDFNVLYYSFKDEFSHHVNNLRITLDRRIKIDLKDFDFMNNFKDDGFVKILLKDIIYDFNNRIDSSINAVLFLRNLTEKYPLSLGIWGNSPILGHKPLIFEFLRSEGIKVLGAQHGSSCGDSLNPWLFDTELGKCDHYISYGFTEENVKELYPGKEIKTQIIPLGSARIKSSNKKKKEVDILFSVNCLPTIFTGIKGTSPHKSMNRQMMILEYLQTLKGLTIYVKLMEGASYSNSIAFPVIKKLNNLRFVWDRPLTEFLEEFNPRITVMDDYSTPLYEVLNLDTEIFVMNNEFCPFEDNALESLKKRVHYSEEVEELISKMNLFLEGKLERRRDNAFYSHFVFKKNTESRVLSLINYLTDTKNNLVLVNR